MNQFSIAPFSANADQQFELSAESVSVPKVSVRIMSAAEYRQIMTGLKGSSDVWQQATAIVVLTPGQRSARWTAPAAGTWYAVFQTGEASPVDVRPISN